MRALSPPSIVQSCKTISPLPPRHPSQRRASPGPLPRFPRVRFPVRSRKANLRAETYRQKLASRWARPYVPAISIRLATRDYRATCAASLAQSFWTMASTSSRTPTPISSARIRNTCTRCGSPRVSCGGSKPHRAMPYISTCGTTTLRAPNSITESERLKALPRLPRDEGEPVFAEPWQAQAFALAVKLSE